MTEAGANVTELMEDYKDPESLLVLVRSELGVPVKTVALDGAFGTACRLGQRTEE